MMNAGGALRPGTKLGHYEVIRLLGKGGMGEVYLAKDLSLGREVALKVLPAEFGEDSEKLARFKREAHAAAALSHPNICTIYEVGEHEGQPFIAMELVEGKTLRDLASAGPVKLADALNAAVQIAEALEAAHKKRVVHRDIKSANILLTPEKHVKVLDFGLAKELPKSPMDELSQVPTATLQTGPGTVIGTLTYMSPEQALGRPADQRSDLFSFGVVLYELLAGRLPFRGDSSAQVLDALVHQDPSSIARFNDKVPDPLVRIVGKLLEKDPEERYQSAHEAATDLKRVRDEVSGVRPSLSGVATRRRWGWRRTALAVGVPVLAVALAIVGFHVFRPKMPVPPAPGTAAPTSLVALPCKVLGSPDMAYLTDAVPSTLSTLLGEIQGLDTRVPPSSSEVEKVHGDLDKIAEAYGVQAFVFSTVTAEGARLVFNFQLADAKTRKVRWSHHYEGTKDDFTALARDAVNGMRAAIDPALAPVSGSGDLAASSQAELALQEGRYQAGRAMTSRSQADFDLALASYERALTLDPKLARAAAAISMLYMNGMEFGVVPRQTGPAEAEAWIQKALTIDPRCSEAWSARAYLEAFRPDPSVERQLSYALKGAFYEPRIGNTLSLAVSTGGSLTLAMECELEDHRRDPLWPGYGHGQALNLIGLGRAEEALPLLDHELALRLDYPWALTVKVLALAELGRVQEANAIIQKVECGAPETGDLSNFIRCARFVVDLAGGDERSAKATTRKVIRWVSDPKWTWSDLQSLGGIPLPIVARNAGKEEALELFLLCGRRGGYMPYDMLVLRPDLKEVREDPRAAEVVQKTKAQFDRTIRILQDARARGELPPFLEKPMNDLLKQLDTATKAD